MSKGSTTSAKTLMRPPSRSARERGPPQNNSSAPSTRSRSSTPSNVQSITTSHSRRPSALGQSVPITEGVSVPRHIMGSVRHGYSLNFGSMDDAAAPVSSSPTATTMVRHESVKTYGSLPVTAVRTSSSMASAAVANITPSTSSSGTSSTSTPSSSTKPVLNVAKLFQGNPSTSQPSSDTISPSLRPSHLGHHSSSTSQHAPQLPVQAPQLSAHPYTPFAQGMRSPHGTNGPGSPALSRAVPNATGPQSSPIPDSGGPDGPPIPASPTLTPPAHLHPPSSAGVPPQWLPKQHMAWPYYNHHLDYSPTYPMQPPLGMDHTPHTPGPTPQGPPHPDIPLSPRTPPPPLPPGTPSMAHAVPHSPHTPQLLPLHAHQPSASVSVSPPPPNSSTSTALGGRSHNTNATTFVPMSTRSRKITIGSEDGKEVKLESLKKPNPQASTTPIPPSSPTATSRRTASVRIESEEAKRKRAEQARLEQKKQKAEERTKQEEEGRKRKEEKAAKQGDKEEQERAQKAKKKKLRQEEGRKRKAEEERLEEERRIEKRLWEEQEREGRERREREQAELEEKERAEREAERQRLEEVEAETRKDGDIVEFPIQELLEVEEGEVIDNGEVLEPQIDGASNFSQSQKASSRIDTSKFVRRQPGPPDINAAKEDSSAPPLFTLLTDRNIDGLDGVEYPESIRSPEAELNQNEKDGKFEYDGDSLLQFFALCKEKPPSLDSLDMFGIEAVDQSSSRGCPGQRRLPSGLTPRTSTDNDISTSAFSELLRSADTNGGVGLSDPATTSQRRCMLDLINRLRNTGVQRDIDLPMIAVIGNQSAGKSSLIESISGITLPRSQGTCTRCPTECKLTQEDTPWTCVVKLHFITDERGSPIKASILTFGDAISNKVHVEERIRRAQRAILNPNTDYKKFLKSYEVPSGANEMSFSRNYVSLEISGRELADVSFVDLPGLIASVGRAGNANDIDLVKNLVISYIEKPSCLILLTVACETDFENQGAHYLARQYDPKGKRTVGVLTKPDRIPLGEEESWIRLIRNEVEHLDNNWYCIKQPSSHDISLGINWVEARNMEKKFFAEERPWSGLDSHLHQFLGTGRLTERLSAILAELIARRLPEIQDELQMIIIQARSDLEELPPAPSNNPVGEIHRVLNGFVRELSELLEGTPDENGLVQTIRLHFEAFKREVYSTAPNFLPWEQKDSHRCLHLPPARFLSNEENVDTEDEDDDDELGLTPPVALRGHAIYIDEVMQRARNGRTRELPDYYPFAIHADYVSAIVKEWQEPAVELFEVVNSIIREHVGNLVEEHFAHLGKGGVKQAVLMIVYDHLDEAAARAKQKIDWLLQIEGTPATLNTRHYTDYRDKFLAHYRGCRETNHNTVSNIRRLAADRHKVETVHKALSSLNELGISAKVDDLSRLLPADPLEVALGIMASVRGYFQVAYKRFVDMVPLAVDYEMVRGMERGLDEALLKGLQITGGNAYKRCAAMLQEPAAIASKRQGLSKKLERLRAARTELKRLSV